MTQANLRRAGGRWPEGDVMGRELKGARRIDPAGVRVVIHDQEAAEHHEVPTKVIYGKLPG
jgi:H2-forming N5,N10-methylenetetrahydromethanopterin dehydrogenase-like enzyme